MPPLSRLAPTPTLRGGYPEPPALHRVGPHRTGAFAPAPAAGVPVRWTGLARRLRGGTEALSYVANLWERTRAGC